MSRAPSLIVGEFVDDGGDCVRGERPRAGRWPDVPYR